MLKRHQVLLTDWLADYVKFIAERYDLSFSEIIRLSLCIHFCDVISEMFVKQKFDINTKQTPKAIIKLAQNKNEEEKLHRLISKVYFEARKAIENRLSQIKSKKRPFSTMRRRRIKAT